MSSDDDRQPRARCRACLRPLADCHCALIPRIDNRVEVLLLQHRRERFHPFNTARLVHQALRKSTLLVDHVPRLAEQLRLQPRAGLLYPGGDARLLDELAPDERPEQLVIVDGTWHQTKTLVRDIPALDALPKFRLAPAAPSEYRIRREPNAEALSTVEATVAALRILEPETTGGDELLAAFRAMVDRHLAHPKVEDARRRLARPSRTWKNVPLALLGPLEALVLAYGEILPTPRGVRRGDPVPLAIVARRWATGELFQRTVRPPAPLDDLVLGHLERSRADFEAAGAMDEVRRDWLDWLRPDDQTIVYSPSTGRMFDALRGSGESIVLKSIDFPQRRGYASLDELVVGEELSPPAVVASGRAGRRLANVEALAEHLRRLASLAAVDPGA